MNKLLATLIDFNSFQSYSLPTGNIDQLTQPQLRLFQTSKRRIQVCHLSRPSRPRCCIRHGRPSHSTRSTCARLRYQGTGHSVDRVISHRTQSVRAVQQSHPQRLYQSPPACCKVPSWGLSFSFLLSRSRSHRSASGLQSARVCRRPTNIWICGLYVDLYRVCCVMYELKLTPAQSIKNRVDMAGHELPIAALATDSTWQSVVLMSGKSIVFETSMSWSTATWHARITSTMWPASASVSYASHVLSGAFWQQMLHTCWFELWLLLLLLYINMLF